jgi:hypothetical protein
MNNKMEDIIEIRRCQCCYPIDRDEVKYQTDIIATGCVWRESIELEYTLQESPVTGNTYVIMLKQPVSFAINMDLWLFYECPLAFYNGYENESEVEQSKFCYGKITNLISRNDFGAIVEFKVNSILTLQEILATRPVKELPKFWTEFLMTFIDRNDFGFAEYGKYLDIGVSAQGDLGQSCLFTKIDNQYYICLVKEHSFSEERIFGGKYLLPKIIQERIAKKLL